MRMAVWAACLLLAILQAFTICDADPYYGALVGSLSTINHGVTGTVYAVDSDRLLIRGFTYDGTAPDAFLWIGDTDRPDASGTILPVDPNNPDVKLGLYGDAEISVRLPAGKTVSDYKWLSVWCRQFRANFGNLAIADSFVNPAVHDLGALPTFAHAVRATSVKVLDAKTFRFEGLYYDGYGPDAYFWAGPGSTPTTSGIKLVWKPDLPATGNNQRIGQAFTGQDIEVTMPEGMTVFDINNIGMWCVLARQNFGHISFTSSALNVPAVVPEVMPASFQCEVLSDNEFQVKWRVDGTDLEVELAGRVDPGNYMAFGLSGSDSQTLMEGSDVVVGWMDIASMSPRAVDYRLQSKAQCSTNDGRGACPDDIAAVGGTNNAVVGNLVSVNGIVRLSYTRPLNTGDSVDQVIPTDREVYISWALGPINPDGRVAKHTSVPRADLKLNFGRQGVTTCPEFTRPAGTDSSMTSWTPSRIEGVTSFTVQIGQSGGERGYTGITGIVGWGIAWYVNELLIPEITVQRGTTYTFQIYGGNDPQLSAQYHPFYITDDSEGGYAQKTANEQNNVDIYAGMEVGPYCEWRPKTIGTSPDNYDSFAAFKDTLELHCVNPSASAGVLTWTPDGTTPDLVYYQCYTHRFLGWKIRVVDDPSITMPDGEATGEATAPLVSVVAILFTTMFAVILF
ncbi:protein Skeletor, isoforms B/C-like [Asterias rubens]|uniref:protein Skeletor, isoforms B/C-like n=1 Tax=Asterias rubens TaxID=7604 RepID=UPI001455BE80|nr:protein Skeletor, isoforms B/C-like [Asterias rubens]